MGLGGISMWQLLIILLIVVMVFGTKKLKSIGVDIPPEDVVVEGKKGTLGRPHVARALVKHGYIKEEDEAFRKYIGRDQPGHGSPVLGYFHRFAGGCHLVHDLETLGFEL